jgi:rhodanese-related sulfurtransferase
VARLLMDRGFTLVRPLAGGLDAWVLEGLAVEVHEIVARRETA